MRYRKKGISVSYASINQSVMFPFVESKLTPTFVTGLPLSANRWR